MISLIWIKKWAWDLYSFVPVWRQAISQNTWKSSSMMHNLSSATSWAIRPVFSDIWLCSPQLSVQQCTTTIDLMSHITYFIPASAMAYCSNYRTDSFHFKSFLSELQDNFNMQYWCYTFLVWAAVRSQTKIRRRQKRLGLKSQRWKSQSQHMTFGVESTSLTT